MAEVDCHAGDAQVSMQVSRKGTKTAKKARKENSNFLCDFLSRLRAFA